jgi:hypothetical protein
LVKLNAILLPILVPKKVAPLGLSRLWRCIFSPNDRSYGAYIHLLKSSFCGGVHLVSPTKAWLSTIWYPK